MIPDGCASGLCRLNDTWDHLYVQESFIKEVVVLTEKEKAVSLEITGDYFTEQEMRDMNVPEPLVVESLSVGGLGCLLLSIGKT